MVLSPPPAGSGSNPWAAASSSTSTTSNTFLPSHRPVIADLALAALKERGEVQQTPRCPRFRGSERALFFMTKQNPVRRFCTYIVDARPFEYFILTMILCNCLALAFNQPHPSNDTNKTNDIIEKVELAFLTIFTTESVLKIIAYGLVLHPGAYLRNLWNVLDFSIVVIGLLFKALQEFKIDVKVLRALRVLRPLRLLSGIPSLQVVLNSIIMAMVPLLHIAGLVVFVIIAYAIIGLELFHGKLHQTCYRFTEQNVTIEMMDQPRPCTDEHSRTGFKCSQVGPEYQCMNLKRDHPSYFQGPRDGIISFDNFLYSMLTVFVCITMEGWTTTGYHVVDAVGSWWPWVYFVTLILLGAFFVMNLILGVLSGEFSKEKQKIDRTLQFRKDRQERREQQAYQGYKEWIELADELSDSEGEGDKDLESAEGNESVEAEPEILVEEVVRTQYYNTIRRFRKFRKRMRRAMVAFFNSRYCFALILILVFLNTVVLTTEHYNQPKWLDKFQSSANIVFVTLFTLEVLLKIAAFGWTDYLAKRFNQFDLFIVVISIVELLLVHFASIQPMGLSVLRCARLLRIFRFTRFWDSLRNLVIKLLKSVKSVASLLVLLALFILISSLLGMQLLGGKFNFSDRPKPRANFDTILQAALTVFQILTGEDWNEIMYHGMIANKDTAWYGAVVIYFVIIFICGNYILLNVFLAIAVDNLNEEDDEEEEEIKKSTPVRVSVTLAPDPTPIKDDNLAVSAASPLIKPTLLVNGHYPQPQRRASVMRSSQNKSELVIIEHEPTDQGGEENNSDVGEQSYAEMFHETDIYEDGEGVEDAGEGKYPMRSLTQGSRTMPPHSSFFIFSDTNKFRIFCHNVVCMSYFGHTVLACILISSILLAAEDPMDPGSKWNKILDMFDYFFTSVFTVEITLKMISYGFCLHEGSFCRSFFNLLDLMVVCIALISFLVESKNFSVIKILRVLRVLRPLRAINRAKGLKHVVQCMIIAVKSIGNIVLVTFLILFMFAVIGVQVFKGTFDYCTDPAKFTKDQCRGQFFKYETMDISQPRVENRTWKRRDFDFDNVPRAMLTLFAVATFEGWPKLLYNSIDSVRADYGPVANHRQIVALFYIAYIILLPFFMINIFVGFVIVTFQREGEAEYRNCELDKNQRKCIEYALKARPKRWYIPEGHFQFKIWSFVVSKRFEIFILLCIIINVVALMFKYEGQNKEEENILDYLNYFFTIIFTIEFFLRIAAFGIRNYFSDPWNSIDFILVIGSYIDIILTNVGRAVKIKFFRLIRVMRLVRLLSKEESIRQLLWTFFKSIQALPYVALLIAMIFFIYAVIGMQLFGQIAISKDGEITANNNFKNFGFAILVLFRCSTGEAWQEIMMACTSGKACAKNIGHAGLDKCGHDIAYLYFISFYFISAFLVINLFVAVIMDNFDYLTRDWSILGAHHLDEFVTRWSEYDPEAKGRVRHLDVVTMLGKINPPLGFGSMCPHNRACQKLVRMNMPLNSDGTVFFNATLFALVRRNLKIKISGDDKEKEKSLDQLNEELRAVIRQVWKRTSPKLLDQIIPPKGSEVVTVGKFYATFLIQSWFRDWQKRKLVRRDTRYIPQIIAGDRAMPHQPTIVSFPRRCSSDLTGEEIQRRRGDKRETFGGIWGRTITNWTRRRSSKWRGSPNQTTGGGGDSAINGHLLHPYSIDHHQTVHPAVMAALVQDTDNRLAVPPSSSPQPPSSITVNIGSSSSSRRDKPRKSIDSSSRSGSASPKQSSSSSFLDTAFGFLRRGSTHRVQWSPHDAEENQHFVPFDDAEVAKQIFAAARRDSRHPNGNKKVC